MDITKETNIEKLKSLAYDQMVQLEQTQQNLRILNARIGELQTNEEVVKKTDK